MANTGERRQRNFSDVASTVSTRASRIRNSLAQYSSRTIEGPLALAAMASPPTVSSANAFSLSGARNFDYETVANRVSYRLSASKAVIVGGGVGFRFKGPPLLGGADSTEGFGTVSWVTDAPYQVIQLPNGTTSISRVMVNDQYVSKAGTTAGGTSPTYLIIDWSTVRAVRKYTLEMQVNDTFNGVRIGPLDSLWAPAPDRMRLALIGDSYTVGTTSDSGGTQLRQTSLHGWLRDLLNADIAACGLGSTGMSTANSKLKFNDPLRIAHAVATNPDVIYIAGSLNDGGLTAATLKADTLALISALRGALPSVPIIVQGPFGGRLNVSANMLAVEDGMSQAVSQFGDGLTVFVPTMRIPNPWLFGTGYQGTENASGNSDLMIGPDQTHPTIYGSEVLGRLMAAAVAASLNTIGAGP